MKVSKDRKDEIRKRLIDTAVDLITEKGFQNATMKEISARADVGSATIYNYFPTKEKILYGYFFDRHCELILELKKIPGFEDYTLKEKFQAQIETLLQLYIKDREFVQIAYKLMFDSPLRTFTELSPVREMYTETAARFIESAVENNEIVDHPFRNFTANLYWDYTGIILLYWLKDESECFSNTTQLIDMSLDVVTGVLKSGVIVRMTDIVSFLFRSHIYSNVEKLTDLFSRGKEFTHYFKDKNTQKNPAGEKAAKTSRGRNGKQGQPE
jgi:AcrR family transcriptional regulator